MTLSALTDPSRLAALDETALLDSGSRASLDRFARIAQGALGVPVCLVSLVDDRRQFFSTALGLVEPWATRRETPLSHSFCKHVVVTGAPLVVESAPDHSLVRDNLAIRDLAVIAYAGFPLEMSDGHVLGAFCAIDSKPRAWTEGDVALLTELAQAASHEIELRRRAVRAERAERDLASTAEVLLAREGEASHRVAAVGHDLRTPLGVVTLAIEGLRAHAGLRAYPEVERLLAMMERNVNHAVAIVGTLQEARSTTTTPVPLATIVVQVCADQERREPRVRLALDVRAQPNVRIEAHELQRCVENLVSNAQRFARGLVRVAVDADDACARIVVEDDGPGLPHLADYAVVWEQRRRFHAAEGKSGSGLGLSLVRDTVLAHGGAVDGGRSELGGARFELSLPRNDGAELIPP